MMKLARLSLSALLSCFLFLVLNTALAQEPTGMPGELVPVEPTPGSSLLEEDPTTGAAPNLERIAIGDSVKGALTPGEPAALYEFMGEAGDIITITMSSDEIDPFLRLGDRRGNQLLQDDDSADNLNARIGPIRLVEDGPYVVVASSFENVVSEGEEVIPGEFTLAVRREEPRPVSYPVEIEDRLRQDHILHLYSFEGQMGDVLSLSLTSGEFDPFLTVSEAGDLTGVTIRDDDSGPGTNALIAPFIVPESAEYFLTVTSFISDVRGAYRLNIEKLEPQIIAYDEVVEATLDDDTPALVFAFEGAAGDIIDAIVDSPTELDTTLTILGPDGAQIAYNDDSSGRNPGVLGLQLPSSGGYTVVVQPFVRGSEGDIRLTVTESESQ